MRTLASIALALALSACGSPAVTLDATSADAAAPDAAPDAPANDAPAAPIDARAIDALLVDDAAPDAVPGTPQQFVIDSLRVPDQAGEGATFGLDINGDGQKDNALAQIVMVIAIVGHSSPQALTDDAVARGGLIVLGQYVPVVGTATFALFAGADPMPAPCAPDGTCGHHLDGTGAFSVATGSPRNPPLAGAEMPVFHGGPGELDVPLVVAGSQPIRLHLWGARVEATIGAPAGLVPDGRVAGAIRAADIHDVLLPGIAAELNEEIARDCALPGAPPPCGCDPSTPAHDWIDAFDAGHDCTITGAELASSTLLSTLVMPDVSIGGEPGLSIGVGFTAVPATFTP